LRRFQVPSFKFQVVAICGAPDLKL
jgi:hypothetical protein